MINLDSSDDDDDDELDEDTQHTHTNTTHTQMHHTHGNTIDETHRRGHPPSVQQLGQSMPTRGNSNERWIWNGSDYVMEI